MQETSYDNTTAAHLFIAYTISVELQKQLLVTKWTVAQKLSLYDSNGSGKSNLVQPGEGLIPTNF